MSRWTEDDYLKWQRQAKAGKVPLSAALLGPPPRPPKYRNQRTAEGDSKKERNRYQELELLEKAGEIRNLRKQVNYALVVNGIHICDYRADAVYEEGARTICEDTKSVVTRKLPAYRIKVKLMQACHGIQVREV